MLCRSERTEVSQLNESSIEPYEAPVDLKLTKWLAVQDKLEVFRLREPDLKDQVWAYSEGFARYRTQSPGADLKVHEYIDWVVNKSPCCFQAPQTIGVLPLSRSSE